MNLSWPDIAAMTGSGSIVAGLLFWALVGRLKKDFVSVEDHDETVERLKALEAKLEMAPSHDDLKAVNLNLSAVGLQMATMTERVEGLKSSLTRIEGGMKLFFDARLQWEKDSR